MISYRPCGHRSCDIAHRERHRSQENCDIIPRVIIPESYQTYLQVESEGIQYDELSTMMLMGNTMSWDIIRDSMATSLENYRRLSDANPNPNPNPNQHLGEKTFLRCGHVYARPYSPGHAAARGVAKVLLTYIQRSFRSSQNV